MLVYVLGIIRNRSFNFGAGTPKLNFETKDKEHHTCEDQIGVKTEEGRKKVFMLTLYFQLYEFMILPDIESVREQTPCS